MNCSSDRNSVIGCLPTYVIVKGHRRGNDTHAANAGRGARSPRGRVVGPLQRFGAIERHGVARRIQHERAEHTEGAHSSTDVEQRQFTQTERIDHGLDEAPPARRFDKSNPKLDGPNPAKEIRNTAEARAFREMDPAKSSR